MNMKYTPEWNKWKSINISHGDEFMENIGHKMRGKHNAFHHTTPIINRIFNTEHGNCDANVESAYA